MPPKATNSSVCSASTSQAVCGASASSSRRPRCAAAAPRGAEAVGVDGGRSRRAVQEAVDLALRVVEPAGAGPAVGAAEDRPVPVLVLHARRARAATRSSASSHGTSTNGSAALRFGPGPRSSQLLRMAGRRMRSRATSWRQHVQADRRGIGIFREGMQAGPGHRRHIRLRRRPSGPGKRTLMGHGGV